jgi:hypothetical protein
MQKLILMIATTILRHREQLSMSILGFTGRSAGLLLGVVLVAQSHLCEAKTIAEGLVIVPENKLPQQARQLGLAMDLHLVNPATLYLYIEQDNGRQVAIFDVSDPGRIKFKKLSEINAPAAFDFVQPAGQSLEMIRYRDGRGTAIIDLSKPKEPALKAIGAATNSCYIVPVVENKANTQSTPVPQDYEVIEPLASHAIAIVKGVVQQQTDEGNGTTYLLGTEGLTVIRNISAERKLAATALHWTNTIDDK